VKSQLFYLGVALLLLAGGVVFVLRTPPGQVGDVRIDGNTIEGDGPPLQRLDAVCDLAGRCESDAAPRGSTEFRTTRVESLQADVLTMTIETERKDDATQAYLTHTLATFAIPLRMVDLEGTRVDTRQYSSASEAHCETLKVDTIYELRGTIAHQVTDILKGGVVQKPLAIDVHFPFSSLEACEGARQAIIDLANEAMQEPKPNAPLGRMGQD